MLHGSTHSSLVFVCDILYLYLLVQNNETSLLTASTIIIKNLHSLCFKPEKKETKGCFAALRPLELNVQPHILLVFFSNTNTCMCLIDGFLSCILLTYALFVN